jgi:hypothetical protein
VIAGNRKTRIQKEQRGQTLTIKQSKRLAYEDATYFSFVVIVVRNKLRHDKRIWLWL